MLTYFSKAFDTVDQQILFKKLNCYEISGLACDWFLSYLLKRKKCVRIENIFSGEQEVGRGVPVSYTHLDVYKRQDYAYPIT